MDAAAAEADIRDLHVFFQQWLGGILPATPEAFAPLEAALAPEFSMVAPTGRRLDRAAVIGWLQGAHGQRGADFRIWIEEVSEIARGPGFIAMAYDECQSLAGGDTRRRATALLRPAGGRLVWVLVHETWAG